MAHIRCDEDGAFIRSTEFCRMMFKGLGVALQSTGGYASTTNGNGEAPHKTVKCTARAMLMGTRISDKYWCFAVQSVQLLNNCINCMTGRPPALGCTKKLIPFSQIFSFGARVKIICYVPSHRSLSACIVGNPRSLQGLSIHSVEL